MKPILLIILIANISFSNAQNTYQAECISSNNKGSIIIKIWDVKKGKKYKVENAQKDAIRLILYSGVLSNKSCVGQNPLLNNQKEIDTFTKYESNFFSKKGSWFKYTRTANLNATLSKNIENKECIVYEIIISEKQLRLFLEKEKIIKPLDSVF